MASLKRWVARLLGLAVLVAAGWFAHDYARSRPRCVIVSDTHAVHFSGAELTLNIGTSDGVELSGDGSTLVPAGDRAPQDRRTSRAAPNNDARWKLGESIALECAALGRVTPPAP